MSHDQGNARKAMHCMDRLLMAPTVTSLKTAAHLFEAHKSQIAAGMEADQKPQQPVAISRPRLPPTEQHLRLLSQRLLEHQKQLEGSEKHASMRRTRQRLPAFKERSRVLQRLQQHGVVVVSGATGK